MIRLLVHHATRGFLDHVDPGSIGDLIADPEALLWLDLDAPTREERALLHTQFGFHPLAIEDTVQAHQRPKLEQYDKFYFLILYTLTLGRGRERVSAGEVALFVGANHLVTVHNQPEPVLQEVAARWRADGAEARNGIGGLLWELLDAVVDDYFPVVDELGDAIDALEDRIFSEQAADVLQPLFQLKKDLLMVRRIITPQRDSLNVLMRREIPFIAPHMVPYMQDVYDHLVRLTDSVDTFRDIITSALDAYLSVTSNRLNQVMKALTALATILIAPTLIAGIYGMNFQFMPELNWRYGYPMAVGLMVILMLGLVYYFRRKDWL